MTTFSTATILNLLLAIATTQANTDVPIQSTITAPDKNDGLSRGMVAVIIGVGLTMFIVVFITFFMIRGYRKSQRERSDTAPMDPEEIIDHNSARQNLGSNCTED